MIKMIELNSGENELGCHIGDEAADFHGPSIQWLHKKVGSSGSIIRQQKISSNEILLILGPEFEQILETTVERLFRISPDYSYDHILFDKYKITVSSAVTKTCKCISDSQLAMLYHLYSDK